MSKTDELRAMREAKYARANALRGTYPKPGSNPVPVAPKQAAPEPVAEDSTEPTEATDTDDGLCGHRSMNGRTCTRETGHAAKSHRYS